MCKSLKPCGENILCKDTCESPYYQCIYCDANHKGLHCDKPIGTYDNEYNKVFILLLHDYGTLCIYIYIYIT